MEKGWVKVGGGWLGRARDALHRGLFESLAANGLGEAIGSDLGRRYTKVTASECCN